MAGIIIIYILEMRIYWKNLLSNTIRDRGLYLKLFVGPLAPELALLIHVRYCLDPSVVKVSRIMEISKAAAQRNL